MADGLHHSHWELQMDSKFYHVCSVFVGVTLAASVSFGAAHSPSTEAPDTKISVIPEPTESPRFLHDESKVTQGSVMMSGRAISYQAEAGLLVVHVKDPLDDDAPPLHEDRVGPPPPQPPEVSMSLRGLFSRGQRRFAPSHHLSVQRGSRIFHRVAAHGSIRTQAGGDGGQHSQSGGSLPAHRQRIQPSRRQRPGVRRRPPAPDSAISAGRTRRRHSTASIKTPMPSRTSSLNSCRGMSDGIRRSTCSVKATERRARRHSPTYCRAKRLWTSTASCCCRRY